MPVLSPPPVAPPSPHWQSWASATCERDGGVAWLRQRSWICNENIVLQSCDIYISAFKSTDQHLLRKSTVLVCWNDDALRCVLDTSRTSTSPALLRAWNNSIQNGLQVTTPKIIESSKLCEHVWQERDVHVISSQQRYVSVITLRCCVANVRKYRVFQAPFIDDVRVAVCCHSQCVDNDVSCDDHRNTVSFVKT